MIFERIEGFGEFRANIRSATVATLLYNANRGKNKRAAKIEDFIAKRVDQDFRPAHLGYVRHLYMRPMTARERDSYERSLVTMKGTEVWQQWRNVCWP